MDLSWTLIGQYLSIFVGVITVIFNYLSVRSNNRNTQKLELTKQEFARENEKIKRDQLIKDKHQALINNFLSSINVFAATKNFENREKAVTACSNLLPILNEDQSKIVITVLKQINDGNLIGWEDQKIASVDQAISHATQEFLKQLDK